MKIMTTRDALFPALQRATGIPDHRAVMPIYHNVRIVANGTIDVSVIDITRDLTSSIDGEIREPGATTAPFHPLRDTVSAIPKGASIELQAEEGQLTLYADNGTYTFPTLDPDEWSGLSDFERVAKITMSADGLRSMIETVRYAISLEETRYYMNGVFFHRTDDGKLGLCASDGHRLALATVPFPAEVEWPEEWPKGMHHIIIRTGAVNSLRKILMGGGDVEIEIGVVYIVFRADRTVLHSTLIEGRFPDYVRVIPRKTPYRRQVDRKHLLTTVKNMMKGAAREDRGLFMDFETDKITLSVSSDDNTGAQTTVPAVFSADPKRSVAFNGRYLVDALSTLKSKTVEIRMMGQDRNDVISYPVRFVGLEEPDSLHLLMPMRV